MKKKAKIEVEILIRDYNILFCGALCSFKELENRTPICMLYNIILERDKTWAKIRCPQCLKDFK